VKKVLSFVGVLLVGCATPRPEVVVLPPPPPHVPEKEPLPPPRPREPTPPAFEGVFPRDGAKVGARVPLDGQELATGRGKVLVVHVFASWCAPCALSLPALQKLYAKYSSGEVAVVGISVDDEEAAGSDFARLHGVKFPVVWDEGHRVTEKWRPATMPTTYVLDATATVRYVHAGFHDTDQIAREVEALQ